METLTNEEIRQKLAKANSITVNELVHNVEKYIKFSNKKKPVIMNANYYSIDYDNLDDNTSYINNLPDSYDKPLLHFVSYIILQNEILYYRKFGSMTKATWIKQILPKNEVRPTKTSMFRFELLNDLYTTYYILKLMRCSLANMRRGVNIIYSKETKNKTILNHPNYHKGKNYFLSVIEAYEQMINDLFFMSGNLIKKSLAEWVGFDKTMLEINEDNIKKIKRIYEFRKFECSDLIKYLETTPKENYKQMFKENNIDLYKYILEIGPSNFLGTFLNLTDYIRKWKFNIYLYNIMNKIENPEDYRFNITIDIE